jgi:hypothetical protein
MSRRRTAEPGRWFVILIIALTMGQIWLLWKISGWIDEIGAILK